MRTSLPLLMIVAAACSIDSEGTKLSSDNDGSVDRDTDAGGEVGDADVPAVDATRPDGGPMPTEPVDLGVAGDRGVHPAIAWTGTDFAILYATATTGGHQVMLRRMPLGGVPGPATQLTTEAVPRKSLSLAAHGAELAIGWSEDPESNDRGHLVVQTRPSGPSGTWDEVELHQDYHDALLVWDGGDLLGVARETTGANESLTWLRFGTGSASVQGAVDTQRDFNELAAAETTRGPLLVSGAPEMWVLSDGSWNGWSITVPDQPDEADAAELSDGNLVGVFVVTDPEGRLLSLPFDRQTIGWAARGTPRELGWTGHDAVVAASGDGVVVAFIDMDAGRRVASLAMLGSDGEILVDRCMLPAELPAANDPAIACASGTCAIVWLEGSDVETDDFVVRAMQVEASPRLVCP